MTLLLANTVQKHMTNHPLLCLLDSGTSHTWIHQGVLPEGVCGGHMIKPIKSTTLAGTLQANQQVTLKNSILPELYRTHKIDKIKALVFNTHCCYNVILGHDALTTIGLKIDFKTHKI